MATQKGILLTTYGMVLHNSDALGFKRISKQSLWDDDEKLSWDFLVLDEVSLHVELQPSRTTVTPQFIGRS